jgi:hypothetical protein
MAYQSINQWQNFGTFHKLRNFPVAVPQQSPAITQTELVLYLSLKDRLEQLQEQVASAEADLKARLEAGASVQPGAHLARLDEHSRRNVAWRKVSEDLADTVFGKGSGTRYCEEVLDSTPATVTTSLIVR